MTRAVGVRIVQIGAGAVGRAVARRVLAHRARWRARLGLDVGYVALYDSTGGIDWPKGGEDDQVRAALGTKGAGRPIAAIPGGRPGEPIRALECLDGPDRVILVDCAAGEATYGAHLAGLTAGAVSVLANKAPLAVGQARYDALHDAARSGARGILSRLYYEATVGAGLPVITTLRALREAGDEVREIRACASGTLGYITSELGAGTTYSCAVRRAHERGYTEPDPRDDLSGLDVARKALILARTIGRRLDLGEVAVEPLLPDSVSGGGVAEFLDSLPDADAGFARRVRRAAECGRVLRYVATVTAAGPLQVGLEEVPADGLVGSLAGPDNAFVIRTEAYADHPLVVAGPGAGDEVTAIGVVTDILAAARGWGDG